MIQKNNVIRLLYVLLTIFLLTATIIAITRQSRSTTDENWFIDAPAHVSISGSVDIINKVPEISQLQTGDLVVGFEKTVSPSANQ